ncbi:MAG: bacterial Ig-like domain-containing protein [Oscillospiraceae bacterium]|nr:bacterial Ig-like domain-containing protein [Oscillospiraceae bacterium]
MRYLRAAAVLIFAACLVLNIWANLRHNSRNNTEGPTIESQSDTLNLSVSDGADALLQGLTATDSQDGDLTEQILVASSSYFVEPGVFDVDYVVFDSHHNSTQYTRRVSYSDYTAPKFHVSQPLVFVRGENIRYLNYITAADCLDGDLTEQIKVKASNVSNYTAGVYPVLLEVTNSHGDRVEAELNVVVLERAATGPKIVLTEYLSYVTAGERFDPYKLIQSVTNTAGESVNRGQVNVVGSVDTERPGSYQLIFSYDDGTAEGRTYMTVIVA